MMTPILIACMAALPGEAATLHVSELVDQALDCKVRPYGGQSRTLCDLAPATRRALAACELRVTAWAGDRNVPCQVEIPTGLYFWGSTVEVCHTVHLNFHGAKLLTAAGVTPIRLLGFGACQAAGRPNAGPSRVVDVLMQPFSATGTVARAYGIEAAAPLRAERVHILGGFTQGIRIVANATAEPPSARANANGWSLLNVVVQGSLHAGVWVDGPDTNVGSGVRVGSTSNCGRAANLASMGPCADIMDGSFLGCTWSSASTGYAEDDITKAVYPGIILGDSANSRSVCLGCYIEGGYGGGQAAAVTNVLGGIGGWVGPGNRLEGNRISGLESVGSDGLVSIKLGSLTGGGALTLTPIGDSGSYPLRFKYVLSSSSFVADVGNLGAAQVLRIGAKAATPSLGLGGLLLRPNASMPNVFINTTGQIVQRQTP